MVKTSQQRRRDLRKSTKHLNSLREQIFNYDIARKRKTSLVDAANKVQARRNALFEREASLRLFGGFGPKTIKDKQRLISKLCAEDSIRFIELYKSVFVKKGSGESPKTIETYFNRRNELTEVVERLADWHEDAERFGVEKIRYKNGLININTSFSSFLDKLKSIAMGTLKFEVKGQMKRP